MVSQHQPGIFSSFASMHDRRTLSEAAFFLPHLHPGMSLLDVGCGSGTITVELAAVVAPAPVVGVDLNEQRIEAAQRIARKRQVENVEFQVGDLCHVPYAENEFDAVFEHMVFMHMPDPRVGVREIFRVLKPGGVFGGNDVDRDCLLANWPPLVEEFMQLIFNYRSSRGTNDGIGKEVPGMLRAAGFVDIEVNATAHAHGNLGERRRIRHQYVGIASEPDFVSTVVAEGWTDAAAVQRMIEAFDRWVEEPGAFHSRGGVATIALKPVVNC